MQVRKDFPEDILPLLFLLRIARFQDDQDEMLSLSNELMQLEPNHYYSCLVLGILSLKRDDVAGQMNTFPRQSSRVAVTIKSLSII